MTRRPALPTLLVAILLAGVTPGCSDDRPPSGPSPTMVAATPIASATPAPSSVPPRAEPPSTVWLINATTGSTHTIFSERIGAGDPLVSATFSGNDSVVLRLHDSDQERVFTLDGVERIRRPIDPAVAGTRCKPLGVLAAEIDGRRYEVNCGFFSPDGSRMLYRVDAGTFTYPGSTYVAPLWDEWLLDLRTGRRTLLQQGLRHCGGCDGRYGTQWSPSGRYVVYAEWYSGADGGFVFLSDTDAGTTRRIAAGPSYVQTGYEPDWASTTDLLLRPGESGGSIIEDLATGRILALPSLAWPARFDATGRLIYSPRGASPRDGAPTTTVRSVIDGALVATLPGAVPWTYGYQGETHRFRVIAGTDGVAAALESASGCAGTVIYLPQLPTGRCIPAAAGAMFSPGLDSVALARKTRDAPPGQLSVWEIVLVDPRTGVERVLARDAISDLSPLITWNESGSYLLVQLPLAGGA